MSRIQGGIFANVLTFSGEGHIIGHKKSSGGKNERILDKKLEKSAHLAVRVCASHCICHNGRLCDRKIDDKELHRTAKTVFIVTLIFTAVEAVILILSGIASLGASMGTALSWIRFFVTLAKIGVYAGGLIMSLFDGGSSEEKSAEAKPAGQHEENTDGEE